MGAALLASEKDRAEHIMLLDLARNDVNRVCQPKTVKVDHLMRLEKFSHVIHLTSQVSGSLREGLTRCDTRPNPSSDHLSNIIQVRCVQIHLPSGDCVWRSQNQGD